MIDEASGERIELAPDTSTIFFIPMTWAGVLMALLGVGMTIYDGLQSLFS